MAFKRIANQSRTAMWSWLWTLLRKQRGRAFSVLCLDCLAWPLDAVVWPYLLGWVVGIMGMFDADRPEAWAALQLHAMVALALVIFVEAASRVMSFAMARLIPDLQKEIRLSMFDHIQRHSIRYFNERFSGALANKITDMTSQGQKVKDTRNYNELPHWNRYPMNFHRAKIVECQPRKEYKAWIRFDDGLEGEVDLSHLVGKGVFSAWDSIEFFNSVEIDPQTDTLAWPNGVDLDPYVLRSSLEQSAYAKPGSFHNSK